jgi:hypothetical protein
MQVNDHLETNIPPRPIIFLRYKTMEKRKRPLAQHPIIRILIIGTFEVIGLILMAILLDGLFIERLGIAIAAVATIGLLNALLWPILSRILGIFAYPPIGFNPGNFPEVQLKIKHANLSGFQTRHLAHSPEVVRRKFIGFI